MKYSHIPGIDKPVSRMVQGTMMINSREPEKYFTLLDAAFELGCSTFDTAHDYGKGDSERLVGRWVNDRGVRDKVVIIGKGAHHNQDRRRVTPFDITSDLYDSLARLKFDYIDLYLLHRDDTSVSVGPIIDILNTHVQSGLIRAFGASNWSHERIVEANMYAQANGLIPFVASSPNFCLAEQFQEYSLGSISITGLEKKPERDWYKSEQMPLFAWSSLAGGFFSGRFTRDNLDTFDNHLDKVCIRTYGYELNFKRLDRVQILAEEKGLSIPQVALAYVFNQPLNIFALVGCQSPDEFRIDSEAQSINLSPSEIAWLELKIDTR